ncbi:hypothetical protein_gp044 [Bacillus phage vB_BceM_WH1]|nr:hypothetical protein_gp044 [Bacillus phage vB_BceM_WH1]
MFTDDELFKYPYLNFISVGGEVIALKDSMYDGLKGVIEEVRYGEERETENDCILDIVVTYHATDEEVAISHPQLNGTSICEVIMGEDELGFLIEAINRDSYLTAAGVPVCPTCLEGIDEVIVQTIQTQKYKSYKGHLLKQPEGHTDEITTCLRCDTPLLFRQ